MAIKERLWNCPRPTSKIKTVMAQLQNPSYKCGQCKKYIFLKKKHFYSYSTRIQRITNGRSTQEYEISKVFSSDSVVIV